MTPATAPSTTATPTGAASAVWEDKFVAYIQRLCAQSTKARADLRSGLGRPLERARRMDPYLAPWAGGGPDAVRARYAVAALIASRPRTARDSPALEAAAAGAGRLEWPVRRSRTNLGASLARASTDGIVNPDSAEDELLGMARAGLDAVCLRLAGLVGRLQAKEVPVDWAVLLRDLARWGTGREATVSRWQTTYYQTRAAQAQPLPGQRDPNAFVEKVLVLCRESKAARADLSRGLGVPVERCHAMHRHLVPLLPERLRRDDRRAHYAVAALIASRPPAARPTPTTADTGTGGDPGIPADTHAEADADADADAGTGLGAGGEVVGRRRADMGAWLAQAVSDSGYKPDAAEQDLYLMARLNLDALHARLPALARRLEGKGARIDFARLLEDLAWWASDRERIAARWMDSYFAVRSREDRINHSKENH